MRDNGKYTKTSLISHFLNGCLHWFVIGIFCSFMVTLIEMLMPQLIRFTVDSVIGDAPVSLKGIPEKLLVLAGGTDGLRAKLWLIGIAVTVLALLSVIFKYFTNTTNARGGEKLLESMRNELFSHIQHLPFSWHMKNQTGDIIQRCTSDVERVKVFITEQLLSVIRIVILMVLSLTFMFSMDVRLSLVAAASIPIILAYSTYFRMKISEHFQECDENEGVLSTIAQENLTGIRVVHAFGRERFEIDRFDKQNRKYADLWVYLMKLLTIFWAMGDFISGLQVMLILILGSVFCVKGTLSAGEFIAFVSYNAMLMMPVRQLGRVISEMSKAGVSIDRIMYILNSDTEKDAEDDTTPPLNGDIEYSHVSFSYDGGADVLHDISFTIGGGTTFGILGATGSGKSTLVHLLNRLYELPEGCGKITIGGQDIAHMKAHWLRSNIGMVLQEPFLFSRTIAENISITNAAMTTEEIRRAASIACIDDAITSFSAGYDTIVGERGVTLSGGQKQRTAIARTLTKSAPIMVFDDSLSAVDVETDARIREALNRNLGDSTVILISHRVTTLMHADKIMVLDNGRIAEIGSHDELMAMGGIYRRICDMQMTIPESPGSVGKEAE